MGNTKTEGRDSHLPLRATRQIDALCDEFEQAWKAGTPPRIEDFLNRVSNEERQTTFRELLELELALRRGRQEKVGAEDYLVRFPDIKQVVLDACRQSDVALATVARDSAATPVAKEIAARPDDSDSGHLEVRCPSCHAPMDVAVDTPLTDLTCPACGSHFSLVDQSQATRMAPSLSTMGRFEVIERLGVGGFGTVWKARDKALDRTVAIKIPRAGAMTPEEQEKFFREARAAAQLRHPSIVSVYEVGRDGASIYIVSDFIRGVTLSDWLTGRKLTSREAVELSAKIADALHHAHENSVVHRDLKPANIMIDDGGQPHLMDFGLARRDVGELTVTIDGQVMGTPAYMSPEQAKGEAHTADRRSDVYSLGVILFQLLTGELPFRGNARMLIHQVINDEPPSPRTLNANINRDLELICLNCLSKDPAERYASAAALEADLRHWLAGEPISIRAPAITSLVRLWLRQNFGAAGWTVVVGSIFGLVVGIPLWLGMSQTWEIVYDALPTARRPSLLLNWNVPLWLAAIFCLTSIILSGYLGLFTAALVRPKNRDADIMAGLVTAVFAGLAVFVFYWGPQAIQRRIETNKDIWPLLRSAFNNPEKIKRELVNEYPDLEKVPIEQRAGLMWRKINADMYDEVRTGLLIGFGVSMALSLVAGVAETLFAGPLIRRYTWYRALIPYSEVALAFAVGIVVAGVFLMRLFLDAFAAIDVVPDVLAVVLWLGAIGLAIWAAARRWRWFVRAALQILWIAIPFFLAYLNSRSSELRSIQANITELRQRVELHPDDLISQSKLAARLADLGSFWSSRKEWERSVAPLGEAIVGFKSLRIKPVDTIDPQQDEERLSGCVEKLATSYDKLGRRQDADRLLAENIADWEKLISEHPKDVTYRKCLATTRLASAVRLSDPNQKSRAFTDVIGLLTDGGAYFDALYQVRKTDRNAVSALMRIAMADKRQDFPSAIDELILGELRLVAGNPKSAEAAIRSAIKRDGTKPYYYKSLGRCLLAQGKVDEAQKAFQETLKECRRKDGTFDLEKADPDQMTAAYLLDLVTEQTYTEHFASDKKLACFPWFYVGQRREIEGKKDAAIKAYERCVELDKGDNPTTARAYAEWRLRKLKESPQPGHK
jgi:tetratricopeptide (TPR) repeat protein